MKADAISGKDCTSLLLPAVDQHPWKQVGTLQDGQGKGRSDWRGLGIVGEASTIPNPISKPESLTEAAWICTTYRAGEDMSSQIEASGLYQGKQTKETNNLDVVIGRSHQKFFVRCSKNAMCTVMQSGNKSFK